MVKPIIKISEEINIRILGLAFKLKHLVFLIIKEEEITSINTKDTCLNIENKITSS